METIKAIYRTKYAKFDGRAGRREFWTFFLWYLLVALVLAVLAEGVSAHAGIAFILVTNLAFLVFAFGSFVPMLALRFRRLHDIDKSAWWIFIGLIPLIGAVVMLVFDFLPGTTGPNRFGPDPKGLGGEQAAEVLS